MKKEIIHKGKVLTTEEVMKGRGSKYEFINFDDYDTDKSK